MNNDKKCLVSIVMPVYNAANFLCDSIVSVLNQTYSNWELLLVNDCSTDKSKEIYEKFRNDHRIKWIEQSNNLGAAKTRNHGIEIAKGRFICFLDSDDKWIDTKIEEQLHFMRQNGCAFSYHSYEFADHKCKPTGKKVIAKKELCYREAIKNTIIFTSTVMFDTTKIDKKCYICQN